MSEIVRIQFDIPIEEYTENYACYIPNDKYRHKAFKDAGLEFCRRREGRDKKHRKEQLLSDMELFRPIIQELIDTGRLILEK